MLQRAKAKAQKAFEQREEAAKDSDSDVGHGGATPSPCAEARSEDAFSHGGISKKWRAKKERAATEDAMRIAPVDESAGPAFPELGVTLEFLETFTKEKVKGRPSRYCTAKVDCIATNPDELSFKAGEILAIADLNAVNDGWFVGYRRAGNWDDRKKFRPEAVDRLAGLSTDEVCGQIIKPETSAAAWPTEEKERSYARMVMNMASPGGNARLVAAEGETGIGKANVFASHAWTFVFEELIQSLRFFEAEQIAAGRPRSYFWLDIFVVDENAAHTYPSSWWQTSFTEAVRAIGHTALVLTPWSAPVPLRRAWCLWEIYSTLRTQARLSVCMSDAETADFHRALVDSVESVICSLCTIDAETAEAGSKKDLDMIFAAVRTLDGGFQTLNVTVLQEMREWLLASITRALAAVGLHFESMPDQYRVCCSASDLDDHELREMFEDSCDYDDENADDDGNGDNRLQFGNWYMRPKSKTAGEMHICANHYQELSRMQKRQFKAIQCVADLGNEADMYKEKRTILCGSVAPGKEEQTASILIAGSGLADELDAEDSTETAHKWNEKVALQKALDLRTQIFGERDVRTAEAMHLVAGCEGLEIDDAFDMLAKALEIQKEKLPADHQAIGESVLSLAKHFHVDCEDEKSALPFAARAVKIFEKNDPEGRTLKHISALTVMARCLDDLERIPESREYYEKAYTLSLKWHGPRHTQTATTASNLADCVHRWYPHETFENVELQRRNLKTMEVMAGMHNHRTADCRESLAHALQACCWLHDLRVAEEQAVDGGGGGVFSPGDRVQILPLEINVHRALGNLHGAWTIDLTDAQVKKLAGSEGTVTEIDDEGDVKVHPDRTVASVFEAYFNPVALKLISKADASPEKVRSEQKFAKWAAWRSSKDPLPKLSTLLVTTDEWAGTEEDARAKIMQEIEALLLSALNDLERDLEYVHSASECAKGLIIMYTAQKRKKDAKAMQKRLDILETWMSDSEDSEEDSDESDDSSASDEDSDSDDSADHDSQVREIGPWRVKTKGSHLRTLDLLNSVSPGVLRKLADDSDEHVSVAELENVMEQIQILNTTRPATSDDERADRFCTYVAFGRQLKAMRKRDQAATLLDGGWDEMIEEGTPPSRSKSSETKAETSEFEPEQESGGSGVLSRENSASPQIQRVQADVDTIVKFVEAHGDCVERRHIIKHLKTMRMEGLCVALEQKYGSRPQIHTSSVSSPDMSDVGESLDRAGKHNSARNEFLQSIVTLETPLEIELKNLRLGALSRRVSDAGASASTLEALQDADDPKAALISWLLVHATNESVSSNGVGIGAISEGTPPVCDLQGAFSDVALEPVDSNSQLSLQPEICDNTVNTNHGVAPGDLMALTGALEHSSPPTHAFGRAATTGVRDADEADAEFDVLLSQLGLEAYGVTLRAHAIVNETELRDMTHAEATELMPDMTEQQRKQWIAWRGV